MTLITSFPRKQESIRYIMDSCLRGNDIILLLLIFLAVCNVAAAADDPKVTSAIDRSSVKIGDHITYTITVTGGKIRKLSFLNLKEVSEIYRYEILIIKKKNRSGKRL